MFNGEHLLIVFLFGVAIALYWSEYRITKAIERVRKLSRGSSMSELSARGKALERVIKEAEQAAEARMREPLKECSHFVANRPSQCPECGSPVFVTDKNCDKVLGAYCENQDCNWVGFPCYTCLFITKARAEERERIERVIRNCCVAITAETLVRAIRRRSGE